MRQAYIKVAEAVRAALTSSILWHGTKYCTIYYIYYICNLVRGVAPSLTAINCYNINIVIQ